MIIALNHPQEQLLCASGIATGVTREGVLVEANLDPCAPGVRRATMLALDEVLARVEGIRASSAGTMSLAALPTATAMHLCRFGKVKAGRYSSSASQDAAIARSSLL